MVALAVVIVLLQLASATMGAYMSGRRHPIWFAAFVTIGFIGAGLVGLQSWKTAAREQKMEANIADAPRKTAAELAKIVPTGTLRKPWGLTPEQLDILASRMERFARKDDRNTLITAAWGNPDSMKFASELVTAFRTAGWVFGESGFSQSAYRNYWTGVLVQVHSRESNPPGVKEFALTLHEAGIDLIAEASDEVPDDRFKIFIGARPQSD